MGAKRQEFVQELCKWLETSPEQIHLYWKGRVALYAILRALGIGEGNEVILPAFTCVVVPNAIIETGATPVYVDIEADTLNAPPSSIRAKMNERTKAVIVQNSFGLSSYVDEIHEMTRAENIASIEDCTHGFGGTFKGQPNGSICDAAFYSTQWNKPFSSGIGGFAMINDEELLPALHRVNEEKGEASRKDRWLLRLLFEAREKLLTDRTYWPLLKLYRRLSDMGLVVGSSQKEETERPGMPPGFFLDFSETQAALGLRGLRGLGDRLARQKKNGELYSEFLKAEGKEHVKEELFPDHSFLKYPIFVRDRELFFREAEKARIPLGDWFRSPLHPVEGDLTPWGLNVEEVPIAQEKAAHVVDLPTNTERIEDVLNFLGDQKGRLL